MNTARSTAGVPRSVYLFLLAGVAATSMAAIFIRLAQLDGAPSLLIAVGRLTLSALLISPVVLRRHRGALANLTRTDLLLALASGAFLALHFVLWITSLELTSVLISVVFVTSGPLWVALMEVVFLRARLSRLAVFGLMLATGGGILIGLSGSGDTQPGPQPLLGALMALGGAITVAAYFVIGRKLRARIELLPYIWLVYGIAALLLIALALLTGTSASGMPGSAWMWIALTSLLPQLIGHTSFNYALRYMSATYVSIAAQLEPILSAVAAMVLLGQIPTLLQGVGSALILSGVVTASAAQEQAASKPED